MMFKKSIRMQILRMIILGIDPGSRITGYGLIDAQKQKYVYLASGCVRVTAEALGQRLLQIFEGLQHVIAQYQPVVCAIEQVFVHRNVDSALKLGQARGVAMVASSYHGLEIGEYTPRQIKQAVVGYGGADKTQVQHMVKTLLSLNATPQADAADALAVAICHSHHAFKKVI